MTPEVPYPTPSQESRPYWEGLTKNRLLLQRCIACRRFRNYPRPLCDTCYTFESEWIEASGLAHIHSWTVVHHAFHPAFQVSLPYTLITGELVEGARLLAQWRAPSQTRLQTEQPIRVGFEKVTEELTLPIFVPA